MRRGNRWPGPSANADLPFHLTNARGKPEEAGHLDACRAQRAVPHRDQLAAQRRRDVRAGQARAGVRARTDAQPPRQRHLEAGARLAHRKLHGEARVRRGAGRHRHRRRGGGAAGVCRRSGRGARVRPTDRYARFWYRSGVPVGGSRTAAARHSSVAGRAGAPGDAAGCAGAALLPLPGHVQFAQPEHRRVGAGAVRRTAAGPQQCPVPPRDRLYHGTDVPRVHPAGPGHRAQRPARAPDGATRGRRGHRGHRYPCRHPTAAATTGRCGAGSARELRGGAGYRRARHQRRDALRGRAL
eukprot:ctg_2606.g777